MRISDWSSDVCSSDLVAAAAGGPAAQDIGHQQPAVLGRAEFAAGGGRRMLAQCDRRADLGIPLLEQRFSVSDFPDRLSAVFLRRLLGAGSADHAPATEGCRCAGPDRKSTSLNS